MKTTFIHITLSVALALIENHPVLAADNDENLIRNPGFEDVAKGSEGFLQAMKEKGCEIGGTTPEVPNGWIPQCFEGSRFMVVTGTAGKEVHSGKRAFLLASEERTDCSIYQECRHKPGPTYRISIWARGQGSFYLRTYEYDAVGAVNTPPFVRKFPLEEQWKHFEATYACTNGEATRFCPVIGTCGQSEVVVDDMEMIEQ